MKFEDAYENIDCKKILSLVDKKLYFVEKSERIQIKAMILWKACQGYQDDKSKFTTYLTNKINYEIMKFLAKNKRFKEKSIVNYNQVESSFFYTKEFEEMLESLPVEDKNLLSRFYIEGNSLSSLAKENKLTRQKMQEKINKSIKVLLDAQGISYRR